jgi:hypothetical protein
MRFAHAGAPGRAVRLGVGFNLYPSEDAAGVRAGLAELAVPLRGRVAPGASAFGFGAWFPARAAFELEGDRNARDALARDCVASGLDPFTANAFPQGGFHRAGLKAGVFEPGWGTPERADFTRSVARLVVEVARARGSAPGGRHLSISTHAGRFGAFVDRAERVGVLEAWLDQVDDLARLEDASGWRVVLAVEPEPRSSANDTTELAALLAALHERAGARLDRVLRHLGACLDACHAAVEFEEPAEALARATTNGTPLGKLQFSSALALPRPEADGAGRTRLLAMDEPVYLHQVTARRGEALTRARDLSEVAAAFSSGAESWLAADEWRCHFHVPVDLSRLPGAAGGLTTTRPQAEALLAAALAAPQCWGTDELHVEIETYTWTLLAAAPGYGTILDGLEREWRHVSALLEQAGWRREGAESSEPSSSPASG